MINNERRTIRNELINQRRRLIEQYFRATGHLPNILSNNLYSDFEEFYRRRGEIGIDLFSELDERGLDVSSNNSVELFRNVYDYIGMGNSTVMDNNTRLLRNEGANIIDNYDEYSIRYFLGDYYFDGIIARGGNGHFLSQPINLNEENTLILLNPHNYRERRFMRNLCTNQEHNIIIGYYGDINDNDRESHREEIDRLSNNLESITIENNNSYSYILTNRR